MWLVGDGAVVSSCRELTPTGATILAALPASPRYNLRLANTVAALQPAGEALGPRFVPGDRDVVALELQRPDRDVVGSISLRHQNHALERPAVGDLRVSCRPGVGDIPLGGGDVACAPGVYENAGNAGVPGGGYGFPGERVGVLVVYLSFDIDPNVCSALREVHPIRDIRRTARRGEIW